MSSMTASIRQEKQFGNQFSACVSRIVIYLSRKLHSFRLITLSLAHTMLMCFHNSNKIDIIALHACNSSGFSLGATTAAAAHIFKCTNKNA